MNMNRRFLLSALIFALVMAGCSARKTDTGEAEKKLADTEKQLQQARGETGAEQRVAELEKQLEEARKEVASAKSDASAPVAPAPAEPPPPPKPKQYVIAAGTAIPVRTTAALSTKTATTGSTFEASLTEALKVDGVVLAPAGAGVTGVVLLSDPGGRVKGKASISIALKSITTSQGPLAIQTNSREAVAKSTVKKDVARGGIMTGAGAAIGAIAGGGRGAAIGAGVGAAAGVGTAMATKGAPAEIPAESALTFTLKTPVTVTVQP